MQVSLRGIQHVGKINRHELIKTGTEMLQCIKAPHWYKINETQAYFQVAYNNN